MFQRIAALFAGIITAMGVMAVGSATLAKQYPHPEGFVGEDLEQWRAYYQGLPASAYAIKIAASVLATFVGALGACFLAKQELRRMCTTIAAAMVVMAIMSYISIQPPMSYLVVEVVGILAMIPLAVGVATKFGLDRTEAG